MLPCRTIENTHFKNLISSLSPNHKHVSRSIIKGRVKTLFQQYKAILRNDLKSTPLKLSISTDGWTDQRNRQFMVVTVHFISKEYAITDTVLAFKQVPPPHDADAISTFIQTALTDYDTSNKIMSITTDNASNIVKACRSMPSIKFHVRCFCHVLNLVAGDGLSYFRNLITAIRKNFLTIKQSAALIYQLEKVSAAHHIPFRTVILDQATRWNSTFQMIQRAIYLRIPLVQLTATSTKLDLISPKEWDSADDILRLLDKFYEFTLEFQSSSSANIGSLHVAYRQIDYHLHSFQTANQYLEQNCTTMIHKLQLYYNKQYHFAIITCILDPRVKMLPFTFIERDELLGIFKSYYEEYTRSTIVDNGDLREEIVQSTDRGIIGGLH